MKENPVKTLHGFGQSVWLDYIRCDLMTSGNLETLIQQDGLLGLTSNPTIFDQAFGESSLYDHQISTRAQEKMSPSEIYEALSQKDVQDAADHFSVTYKNTQGKDGMVSLEVNPHLAYESKKTLDQARRLWAVLARPNVMIKIPGTQEGLPVIQKLISEGININVTLLFGLDRYRQVVEAYISGLEQRLRDGQPLSPVRSVASFFLSRIDAILDPEIEKVIGTSKAKPSRPILGQVALSMAKVAYSIYTESFTSERFKLLAREGANPQRLLWASTSPKNPQFGDTKYIDPLIGHDTVTTLPLETFNHFRDHGDPKGSLEPNSSEALGVLDTLAQLGIDLKSYTQELEKQGVRKFIVSYDSIMEGLKKKTHQLSNPDNKT